MKINLVPNASAEKNFSYWCTWATQNFSIPSVDANNKPVDPTIFEGVQGSMLARNNLNEKILFENPGWVTNYFSKIRSDLYLMFDDGWDVGYGLGPKDIRKFGSLEVSELRFPSCTGNPAERLYKLNKKVKEHGWRGAGLWVASQPAVKDTVELTVLELEEYYRERAKWCKYAGIEYWKVDWGMNGSIDYRKMMTRIVREVAPDLAVEHAFCSVPLFGEYRSEKEYLQNVVDLLSFSDIFRTYDYLQQLAVPTTIDRISQILLKANTGTDNMGLLNCEDEVYLAVALGFAFGAMRHPLWNERPTMNYDPYNIKKRNDEVVRAARWQRISPPFGIGKSKAYIDTKILSDKWFFEKGETWCDAVLNKEIIQSAPAIISRGMPLPEVKTDGIPPFVVSSQNPNGTVAIATLPRAIEGKRISVPLADICLDINDSTSPIGVFGYYRSLTLKLPVRPDNNRIYAQDLAGDEAVDITEKVRYDSNKIIIPGDLIKEIGTSSAEKGDISDPGLVLNIRKN